jgi:DNA/RNA non-specific endonuclease
VRCMDVQDQVQIYESWFEHRDEIREPGRAPVVYRSVFAADGTEVVVSLRATLTPQTTPARGNDRLPYPPGYRQRMQALNQIQGTDDVGHLLALSLGGPANSLQNLMPQRALTNRNLGHTDDSFSYWRQVETDLRRILLTENGLDHINWMITPIYEGDWDIVANRRPVGFGLQYITLYTNGTTYDSGHCFFSNDIDGGGHCI